MDKKKKMIIGGVILVAIVAAVVIGMYLRSPQFLAGKGVGNATGKTAITMMQDMYGESKLEKLADVSADPEGTDPMGCMVEDSVCVLDQEYVNQRAETEFLIMESAAQAAGKTYEQYIADTYDGKTTDEYEQERVAAHEEFLKERLVAYEIAKKEGITITTDEYEELLPEYAEKFGYEDDTERFAQECDKDTIAAEMLYDKACSYLEKKAG